MVDRRGVRRQTGDAADILRAGNRAGIFTVRHGSVGGADDAAHVFRVAGDRCRVPAVGYAAAVAVRITDDAAHILRAGNRRRVAAAGNLRSRAGVAEDAAGVFIRAGDAAAVGAARDSAFQRAGDAAGASLAFDGSGIRAGSKASVARADDAADLIVCFALDRAVVDAVADDVAEAGDAADVLVAVDAAVVGQPAHLAQSHTDQAADVLHTGDRAFVADMLRSAFIVQAADDAARSDLAAGYPAVCEVGAVGDEAVRHTDDAAHLGDAADGALVGAAADQAGALCAADDAAGADAAPDAGEFPVPAVPYRREEVAADAAHNGRFDVALNARNAVDAALVVAVFDEAVAAAHDAAHAASVARAGHGSGG